jgi:hypothetical protein
MSSKLRSEFRTTTTMGIRKNAANASSTGYTNP